MMLVLRLGEHIGARPGWNDVLPCVYTLVGGTWADSGVAYWVFTLGGGVTCGGEVMLKISLSYFRASV